MSPELRQVLEVLAKHKVSVPVAALLELGILNETRPLEPVRGDDPALLRFEDMQRIARKEGFVRWNTSGVAEQLKLLPSGAVEASGYYTIQHTITEEEQGQEFNCREISASASLTTGKPWLLPRRLLLLLKNKDLP